MEHDIGSIAVGKKADLVIFDALSPAMIGAAQRDPVMAIVLHSTIRDVNTVLVNGEVRKENGQLCPVKGTEWNSKTGFLQTNQNIHWQEVADRILAIQRRLVSKTPGPLLFQIEDHVRQLFGHKPSASKI
ncbi:unnamed protein product [Penicillium olsonii]|nr:unnamed protein product [Penicillium olsonii]CAG7918238.1 unnamed protein product [Penicillium olsonii]